MPSMRFLGVLILLLIAANTSLSQDLLPELVRRIKPSAVAIETFDVRGEKLSRGSGFFIDLDRIVTNRHVLDGAYRAEVHSSTGAIYPVKSVLAVDAEGDIALLKVDAPASGIRPLPIIKTTPQEGESVVVIGNPLGLEGSVTNGIVSAVRDIPTFGRIIQITAPISAGSSGSPVVNMVGARSAAMAFNRIADRRYDAKNPRTASRALPAGLLPVGFVWLFTIVSAAVFLFAAAMLNRLTVILAPVALGSVLLYSFTKRWTLLSHIVLGWCLAIAPTAAWIAVRGQIGSAIPLVLSAVVLLWTAGFDVL